MGEPLAIAIVGAGGVFPGAATLDEFWKNIIAQRDMARRVPDGRWVCTPDAVVADRIAPDRVQSLRGCFVEPFTLDAAGLDINLRLLDALDPVCRFALKATRDAWVGGRTESLDRSRVGVILAAIALPTDGSSALTRQLLGRPLLGRLLGEHRAEELLNESTPHPLAARVVSYPALLAAQALGLGGGAYTLDAACASSLYAIKLACDELTEGRLDAAIAGGVSRPDCLYTQMGFTQLRALSPTGRCAPFDAAGDGLVVGEGAGAVLLKRRDDALRDGDRIHGVIRGIGLSNDIGGALLAPESEGQLRALRAAYQQAGWAPGDVDFIECHGTGTQLGDAVEIASLTMLWGDASGPPGRCPIGSVKSNIGHLLTAAGAAGLVKVLLGMRAGTLPPSANFERAPSELGLEDGPFRVQTQAAPWPHRSPLTPRRAAISAFGFGGINAHLLVEEHMEKAPIIRRPASAPRAPEPLAIVGLAARLGTVEDPRAFARIIRQGRDAFRERPVQRWHGESLSEGYEFASRGAFLEAVSVPIGKYRVPPSEIAEMLPQHLLMLEAVGQALADARLAIGRPLVDVGVLLGIAQDFEATNFHLRWWILGQAPRWARAWGLSAGQAHEWTEALMKAVGPALTAGRTTGALGGMIASRIAREFRFGGPSFAVSCDENSGLWALKIAADALRRGELNTAIVGAVDLCGDVRNVHLDRHLRERLGMPQRAPGEGAVALVLKRLADARGAGDRVYAILRDVAPVGPSVEELRPSGRAAPPLDLASESDSAIGNIGNCGAALGLASLTKAVLCLHHEFLPPPVGSRQEPSYWFHDRIEGPRRMSLTSVTLDGGTMRAVLEADVPLKTAAPVGPMPKLDPSLAFVFPGSGNDFPRMGEAVALRWPAVARALDAECQRLRTQIRLAEIDASLAGTIFSQVAYGVLMSDLLRWLGLRPGTMIGYSLGESAALFASRAWPDRDEMLRRMIASPLFRSELAPPFEAVRRAWSIPAGEPIDWRVTVVGCAPEKVRAALGGLPRARLLIVNTPGECVVGGLSEDLAALLKRLGKRGVAIERVPSVHCDVVRAVEAEYLALHDMTTQPPTDLRLYSAAGARSYDVDRAAAARSITDQALHGFDFAALIEQAYADGVRSFVEVGPGASCTRMIRKVLGQRPHLAISACDGGPDPIGAISRLVETLAAQGFAIDMNRFNEPLEEPEAIASKRPARSVTVAVGGPRRLLPPPQPQDERRPSADEPRPSRRRLAVGSHAALPSPAALAAPPTVPTRTAPRPLDLDIGRAARATALAHEAFLRFSAVATAGMAELLDRLATAPPGRAAASPIDDLAQAGEAPAWEGEAPAEPTDRAPPLPAFSREQCLEFARGRVAKVLGPRFAEVDDFPTRVRLPDEPLMLVDRILTIEGTMGELGPGRIVTEHDVRPGAWYLDDGRCPICITVEAGQADLFLSGYLGIDLITRGLRTYRLLDATVTFQGGLPRPGQTIRYDIRIDRFVRQGDTRLFFFEFDGTIDGRSVLTMRNGCAGFFTPAEIENSAGIVLGPEDAAKRQGKAPPDFRWPLESHVDAPITRSLPFDERAVDRLRDGDLAGCFGPPFERLALRRPPRLPGDRMTLIHRITALEPRGGRYGLGRIVAEADVRPDDWYLTCHFVDDRVMPGTLMYECCAHALRFFLLRMGWVAEADASAFEPAPGIASSLRCRGPVTPRTKIATYEIEIKEVGFGPQPYVLADAMMSADGQRIVRMDNMSMQLTGATQETVAAMWSTVDAAAPREYGRKSILAFAVGKPSEAFGERYRAFDHERFIARLPGPPYSFIDRIRPVAGEPWALHAGAEAEAEYHVPNDAWYFAANRQPSLPYAVLLEAALQPCGWLAAYCGSALHGDGPLHFRNLDGEATLRREVFAGDTLRTRVRLANVSKAGGMIIEQFDISMRSGSETVYEGHTTFGFFPPASLSQQIGIRDAASRRWRRTADDLACARSFDLPDELPLAPDDGAALPDGRGSGLLLPGRAFRMVDRIDALRPDGGPHGLGYVAGSADVDPAAWFFKAHFHQDPVWPGSLGLEALLQLLKVFALEKWPTPAAGHRFTSLAVDRRHRWSYRGQVVPTNRRVVVEAVITACEEQPAPTIRADGLLAVDGVIIYEMKDFALSLVRWDSRCTG